MFLKESKPEREGKGRIHKTVIFKLPLASQITPNLLKMCVVKSQSGDFWLLGFLFCIWGLGRMRQNKRKKFQKKLKSKPHFLPFKPTPLKKNVLTNNALFPTHPCLRSPMETNFL